MLNIGISLICFKRLGYLQEVVQSLRNSIDYSYYRYTDFILHISADFYHTEIIDYIKSIDWIKTDLIINRAPIGCNANSKQAICRAIEQHDAIIYLEDDTLLAKDAIDFFVDHLHQHKNDHEILSVGGYNRTTSLQHQELLYQSMIRQKFCCWGVGFWKSKIDTILNNWIKDLNICTDMSWDTHLENTVFNTYYQIVPEISRIQNIGARRGTYQSDVIFYFDNHYTPFTSNDFLLSKVWKNYAKNN